MTRDTFGISGKPTLTHPALRLAGLPRKMPNPEDETPP